MTTAGPIVTASAPTLTSTGAPLGIGVDIAIQLDDRTHEGTVTLCPDSQDSYGAWSEPAAWISDSLLGPIMDSDEPTELMDQVEIRARQVIESHPAVVAAAMRDCVAPAR